MALTAPKTPKNTEVKTNLLKRKPTEEKKVAEKLAAKKEVKEASKKPPNKHQPQKPKKVKPTAAEQAEAKAMGLSNKVNSAFEQAKALSSDTVVEAHEQVETEKPFAQATHRTTDFPTLRETTYNQPTERKTTSKAKPKAGEITIHEYFQKLQAANVQSAGLFDFAKYSTKKQ